MRTKTTLRAAAVVVFVTAAATTAKPVFAQQMSFDGWTNGAVRVGPSTLTCNTNRIGAIRYQSTGTKLEYCNGSAWGDVGSGGGGGTPAGSNTQIQFNSGGSFGASSNFVWSNSLARLTVTGDIYYSGLSVDTSDRRLKENITLLADRGSMLDKVMAIKTYSFTMKGAEKPRTEFGVIAQELEPVFPELVVTDDDEMGTKSVNYTGLIPVLLQAIQEQQRQIDSLKKEIEALK